VATDTGQQTTVDHLDQMLTLRAKIHVFNKEPPELVTCDFCANEISADLLAEHVKDDCTKVHIRCKLGCGLRVTRGEMDEHTTSTCPKREDSCPDCGEVLWAEEMEEHRSVHCPEAPKECELLCGTPGLSVRSELHHRIHECQLRLVKCNCGMSIVLQDMPDHKMADCVKKLGPCPQGCGAQVPRDELKEHMDQTCPNQTAWGLKYRNCPLGCKQRFMRKEMLSHISFFCPLRLADCPMGCGNICKHDKLSTHLVYCPMRSIACDHGQEPCRCPLYHWFYTEVNVDDVYSYQKGFRDDSSLLSDVQTFPGVSDKTRHGSISEKASILSSRVAEIGTITKEARQPYHTLER